MKLLNDAGIDVITDILKIECTDLNKRYITYINQKRPYVILKWAQTNDGFIAPDKNELSEIEFEKHKQISAKTVQKITHMWRTQEDAFMVGTNTALVDNPKLNVRHWQGRNPKRVVLDLNNRLPKSLNLFDGTQPTFVFVYEEHQTESTHNITYIPISSTKNLVPQILTELYKHHIQSLVIEGGTQILQTFIDSNVWDEAIIIEAPHQLIKGIKAPTLVGKNNDSLIIENNIITRINHQ
jgi:diaminohydroxyphosphoribosylaminopyrimidine deaminase/5-amino-6-(5-phosphoribosylamino)uracil reductase